MGGTRAASKALVRSRCEATTNAALRAGSGCTDTDNNSANFSAGAPTPRNSATAANYCTPTQLVITSISPASPTAGVGFDVTVEARNANNVAQNVIAATLVTLTTNGNAGAIGGTTSNTIANGTSSIVISGVTLASAGTLVTLTATPTPGQTCLTAGTSGTFTVQASGANTSVQFNATSSSASEGAGSIALGLGITNFDVTNATSVTISASGATGRITSFTTPVTFPANDGSNQSCTVVFNNDLLCNGDQNVVFTITGISGGQGTPTIGANNTFTLTVLDNDVCTNVSFAVSSASVSEGVGTYNVTVNITDPSGSQATDVDVALASGNAARINGFSSQSISFPAGSSTPIDVTITVTDNAVCGDGDEVLTFSLENLSGGQGTPTVGPSRTLTVQNNDNPVDPVTNTANPINYYDFTGLWSTVNGASYFLDVSLYSDFYTPGNTNLVEWNFPAATNDNIADGGIAANNAKTLTGVGVTNLTYNSAGNGGLTARADGWNSGNGTKYWEVELVTTGYGDLKVSSKQRGSNTGPRDFKLQYKIGAGGTWTDVSGATITVADNYTTGVLNAQALPAACDNQASVFLRWIMTSNTSVNNGTVAAGGAGNIDDVIVTGRVPSYVSGYENLPVAGTSQSVAGLSPFTTYYYRVRSTGGCSTGNNSNTTAVTTNAIPNYYSRATGNVTDPIWSDTPNGTAGPAVWSGGSNMTVQSPDVVTNTANVSVGTCTVDAGGTLVLNGGTTLSIHGGGLFAQGTFTASDNSTVEMLTFGGTGVIPNSVSFYDLTINLPGTVAAMAAIDIRGTLQLTNGTYDDLGGATTLRSTASYTGRLGPVSPTASYTGNLKIERYIPAGATNWRLLGSPIAGRAVGGWQDDFVTAGYPGSTWPNFDQPVGSNILWPSIRWYDETNPGAGQNDGMVGVSSNLQSLVSGQGFAAWCGDNLVTTNAFVIDLGNGAPVIASTPITLPMTYTNTGNPGVDGWNLLSNPVPSPIAFDQISRGADVEDFITYYNPANGNTAVWDIGLNSGTNGASNTIQSMQGFFLKAVGPAVTTTVEEADKVSGNGGGMFGTNNSAPDQLRLRITSGINSFSDETVIIFSEGATNLDESDVLKYVFGDPAAPQIACVVPEQVQLAIDAHGSLDEGFTVPLSVNAGVTGEYTITLTEVGDLGLTCITLEDTELGTFTVMNSGSTYTFTMDADDDPSLARFVLRATAPIAFSSSDALCGADPDGQASVNLPVASDVTWTDGSGVVILAQSGVAGEVALTGLGAGSYAVHVSTTSACGELVQDFTINAPFVLEAQGTVTDATCADSEDGSVDLLPLGGVFPYTFLWNDANASTTEDLTALSGMYTVTITDANNCTWTSAAFVIDDQGPDAALNASATMVLVNNAVQFNGTDPNASYFWDFGDGATSTDISTEHAWPMPGTYTVTMTVDNGNCSVSSTIVITVELNTGIYAGTKPGASAWLAGDQIIVQHAFGGTSVVQIELVDATGRVVMQRNIGAATTRALLPAQDLATGIWFVRMAQGQETITLRVPVVR
ncbi:MAG: PKD domain-containing protein [Flavobacteriales bacterium]|nr:PKD domain-containing protein [Flavobacteriales bacterium]